MVPHIHDYQHKNPPLLSVSTHFNAVYILKQFPPIYILILSSRLRLTSLSDLWDIPAEYLS
jgi:hypothetical protein